MSNTEDNVQPASDAVMGADGNPVQAEKPEAPAETNSADAAPATSARSVAQVPRISIHVFCEKPETAESFQGAAEDRRLSKAHITVQMGGVSGAAEHFQTCATPNLIVVETMKQGQDILGQLGELASVCDPSTKVIVVGQMNDITMYRELIRQGVSEYLVAPLAPLQIIDSISSLYVNPEAPPIGHNIAFVGARGGAGSSSIAHNIGWLIAEKLKEDTTIVDLDLPFGTAGLDFNQDPAQGIGDALTSPERVDDVLLDRLLVKYSDRLSLFTSPGTLDRQFDLDPAAFESVLDIVRKSVPYVIIDMPHIWTAWSKSVLLSSDDIVLVATPDLASLRNTKNFFELLKVARPNDLPPRLVINQAGTPKRPEIPEKDFAEAIGVEPSETFSFDPNLYGTASNNGQMLAEVDENSDTVKRLEAFAEKITGRAVQEAPKKNGLFDLLKVKKRSA